MLTLSSEDFFNELITTLHYHKFLEQSNQQKEEYLRIYALRDIIKALPQDRIADEINQILLDSTNKSIRQRA